MAINWNTTPTAGSTSGGIKWDAPAAPSPAPSANTKPDSFLSMVTKGATNLINNVERPFVGLAALPLQAGVAATNAVAGTRIPDPFAQGMPGPGGTTLPVTPLNAEAKLGDAAQVGSYFVPGSGVLSAAGMGTLQGAGAAMSNQDSLPDVAIQGGLGAVVDGGTAGLTKLLGSGLARLSGVADGTAAHQAVQGIHDAYSSALNLSASERGYESRSGKDLAQVLLDHNAPLARNTDGTLDASAALPKLEAALTPLNQKAQARLSTLDTSHTIDVADHILKPAVEKIRSLGLSAVDEKAMIAHARDTVQAEVEKWGQHVPPSIADQIKSGFWKGVGKGFDRDTKLRENATYQLGNAAKTAIEKIAPDLTALNEQRGNLIDAITRLTKLDGAKKVAGGRLGSMLAGMTGAIVGSHAAGIPGALAGDYFSSHAANFVNNPATQIAAAQAKQKTLGALPNALGDSAKPVGAALKSVGAAVKKSARVVGAGANLLIGK